MNKFKNLVRKPLFIQYSRIVHTCSIFVESFMYSVIHACVHPSVGFIDTATSHELIRHFVQEILFIHVFTHRAYVQGCGVGA